MTRHIATMPARRGVAAIWAIVVLGVLAFLLGTIAVQWLSTRRVLYRHQDQVQSLWLARAGMELAAERLLTDPTGYKGETVSPIAESQVRIVVAPDKADPNTFLVTSEARYPTGDPRPVVQSLNRRFRRIVGKGQVRLEVVSPTPDEKENGAKQPSKAK